MKRFKIPLLVGLWAFCISTAVFLFSFASSCSDGGEEGLPEGVDAAETAASMEKLALAGIELFVALEAPDMPEAEANVGVLPFHKRVLQKLYIDYLLDRHLSSAASPNEANVDIACDQGGRIVATCEATETQSVIRISASNCVETSDDLEIRMSGAVQITVNDPDACDNGIDNATNLEVSFDDYTITMTSGGSVVMSIYADGVLTLDASGPAGCETQSGSLTLSNMRFDARSDETGINLRLTTSGNLSIVLEASQNPCLDQYTVDGTMGYEDLTTGERIQQTFTGFQVTEQSDNGGSIVTVEGQAWTSCLGTVEFETVESLVFTDEDDDCPTAGEIRLTIVDTGEASTVTYTSTGGAEIDHGEDGEVDLTVSTCEDLRESGPCY